LILPQPVLTTLRWREPATLTAGAPWDPLNLPIIDVWCSCASVDLDQWSHDGRDTVFSFRARVFRGCWLRRAKEVGSMGKRSILALLILLAACPAVSTPSNAGTGLVRVVVFKAGLTAGAGIRSWSVNLSGTVLSFQDLWSEFGRYGWNIRQSNVGGGHELASTGRLCRHLCRCWARRRMGLGSGSCKTKE
jgi:hypothetical protein